MAGRKLGQPVSGNPGSGKFYYKIKKRFIGGGGSGGAVGYDAPIAINSVPRVCGKELARRRWLTGATRCSMSNNKNRHKLIPDSGSGSGRELWSV